jgi:hypothetical protein
MIIADPGSRQAYNRNVVNHNRSQTVCVLVIVVGVALKVLVVFNEHCLCCG